RPPHRATLVTAARSEGPPARTRSQSAEASEERSFDRGARRCRPDAGPAYRRTDMTKGDAARERAATFHLFTYGTLRRGGAAAELLEGCELVGKATVTGTLFDIDGEYPAMILAGPGTVEGEVWRCPTHTLARLDEYEGVAEGL